MDLLITIFWLFLFTCIPALELRFSIPMGIFAFGDQLHWTSVVIICTLANILLGIGVFEILAPILRIMRKFKFFEERIWPHVVKRQERLRPVMERHGQWGLAIFIGIPLPGTGAVTGALGAFCFAFKRKTFYIANILGVVLAAICVTTVCLLIRWGAIGEDSIISKLFIKQQHEEPSAIEQVVTPTAEVTP